MTPVLPPLRKAAKSARIPIADTTPFATENRMPLALGSTFNFRSTSSATATGRVPTVNKNCRLSAGISDAASLESTAHAPQASTANTEYQNHGLRNIMSNLFQLLPVFPYPGAMPGFTGPVERRTTSSVSQV